MKDNEFKARNKDTDFSKKVEADTVLGRQSAKGSAKPFTSSEHNRYQQKFLDTEKPLDTSTVQNPSDSQEILKPTENNTEQQEDLANLIKRNLMLILLNIPQIVRRKKRSRIVPKP